MRDKLHKQALLAAKKSYSPYSNFPVGAAILGDDGKIYSGCNVENASYPEGWCAETSAISQMVLAGAKNIEAIAVVGLKADICTPCGGCRQRLAEFGTSDTKVYLCNSNEIVQTISLGELLPNSFKL